MSDLIDRDALKEEIKNTEYREEDLWQAFDVQLKIIQAIDNQPTVKAEPMRRGHWIPYLDYFKKCSECGDIWHETWVGHHAFSYCPKCGAKMEI